MAKFNNIFLFTEVRVNSLIRFYLIILTVFVFCFNDSILDMLCRLSCCLKSKFNYMHLTFIYFINNVSLNLESFK